jgi:hypothetical protein
MTFREFAGRCQRKIIFVAGNCRQTLIELVAIFQAFVRQPRECFRIVKALPEMLAGSLNARDWTFGFPQNPTSPNPELAEQPNHNPLALLFESHSTGRGIWKFLHYFDIYHRHFGKFVGKEVHVVEIGVFSGGSLEMWKNYFGPKCTVYGVDIREECKAYAGDGIEIFIGDQADPSFWKQFKEKVPKVDIIIDDGGHETKQQVVSLESMLPHLQPGGVYLCEDVHFETNRFAAYTYGLSRHLNAFAYRLSSGHVVDTIDTSKFQRSVHSVHLYPYVTVIEKPDSPLDEFKLPMHGTEWLTLDPFFQS